MASLPNQVFADRRYEENGALVARSQPNAVIDNDDEALAQVLQMIKDSSVTSVNGKTIKVQADKLFVCMAIVNMLYNLPSVSS